MAAPCACWHPSHAPTRLTSARRCTRPCAPAKCICNTMVWAFMCCPSFCMHAACCQGSVNPAPLAVYFVLVPCAFLKASRPVKTTDCVAMELFFSCVNFAVMSRAGARTWLQPTGHGDMQGFDSSFAASVFYSCQFWIAWTQRAEGYWLCG